MRDNLPTPRTGNVPEIIGQNGHSRGSLLREWIGSPVGRAIAESLPDVIRMASRSKPQESRPLTTQILPSSDGASGVSLSEVEVDVDLPFIHRVTIRSASSWSVAPDMIRAEQQQRKRGRWKLRAFAAGVLGVAGFVLARRNGISLPARVNPAANLPFLSTITSLPVGNKKPGTAE
jgi:hypothetical protein